jgi:hypothetical protein
MPDVDVSPYARIGQVNTNNLLGPLATIAHVQNLQNQNALFQQEFAAKKALGPLAQQSVGPDGKMDWDKFIFLTSIHPDASFLAPHIAAEVSQRKLTDAATIKETMQTGIMKMGVVANIAGAAADSLPKNDQPLGEEGYRTLVSHAATAYGLKDQKGNDLIPNKEIIGMLSRVQGMTNNQAAALLHQTAQASQSASEQANNHVIDMEGARDQNGNTRPVWLDKLRGTRTMLGGGEGNVAGIPGAQPGAVPGPSASPSAQLMPDYSAPQGAPTSAPAPAPTSAESEPAPESRWTFGHAGPVELAERKDMADYRVQVNENAKTAMNMKNVMFEAKELLNNFSPDRAGEFRTEVARWMRAAHVSEDLVRRVQYGDVGSAVAFNKLMVFAATQWMSAANSGNAKARSLLEWDRFQHSFVNLNTDPDAITKMFDFMNFQADLAIQEQKGYQNWRSRNQDERQWPAVWTGIQAKLSDQHFNSEERKRSLNPTPTQPNFTPPPRPAGVDLGNVP